MKNLYLLFLSLVVIAIPATAQVSPSAQFLRSLRAGEETVLLSQTARVTNPSLQNALRKSYRTNWSIVDRELKTAQEQLWQQKSLSLNNSSSASSSGLTDNADLIVQNQLQVTRLKQHLNGILYHWGEALDRAHLLGYPLKTEVNSQGTQAATLSLNGRTVLIQDTPGKETTVYPEEIYTNATTVKALMEAYDHLPEIVSQQNPENIAGWVYLRTNFSNALEEFEAAKEAFTSLQKRHGLFAGVQNYHARHTEKGITIVRNYNYAAANLSLYSAKMLQFISAHKDIFPRAIESYKQIMQLHNENSGTPQHFQQFWSQALIPAI